MDLHRTTTSRSRSLSPGPALASRGLNPISSNSQQPPGEAFHVLFTSPVHVKEQYVKEQSSPLAGRSGGKNSNSEDRIGRGGDASRTFRDYTPAKHRGFSPRGGQEGRGGEGGRGGEVQTPPPPTMSLFDTGAFQKSAGMEQRKTEKERERERERKDSPAPPPPPASTSMMYSVEDYESRWVQVYGFNGGDLSLVLREFSKCGEIVDFGHASDGPYVNWVYIGFDSKFGAQRALLRSGSQLSPTCMVGVKEVDEGKGKVLGGVGDRRALVKEMVRGESKAKEAQRRRKKAIAAGGEEGVREVGEAGLWEKFNEFVLGI